jgi:hypothetical protein
MTNKIVDISDEIYRELGEPSDLSYASIAFWLRTNIGDLNILINKKFYIIDTTLEIGILEGSGDVFGDLEKSIFKMIYSVHYYERLFRNALGAASTDSTLEINQNGFMARKINKNELAKTYAQLRKQIADELEAEDLNAGRIRLADLDDGDEFYDIKGRGKKKKKGNKRTREQQQDLQIEKKTQITDAYTTYK